jgi:hypothetical protein
MTQTSGAASSNSHRSDAMRRHQRRWHSAEKPGEPYPATSSSLSDPSLSIDQFTASPINHNVSRSPIALVLHAMEPKLIVSQQVSAPGAPDTVWDSAPPAIISEVQSGAGTFSGLDDVPLDGIDWNAPSLEALLLSFVGANIPGPELGENSYEFGGAWMDWEPASVAGLDSARAPLPVLLPTSTVAQSEPERGQGGRSGTGTGSSRPSGAWTLPTDTDSDMSMGGGINHVSCHASLVFGKEALTPIRSTTRQTSTSALRLQMQPSLPRLDPRGVAGHQLLHQTLHRSGARSRAINPGA